MERTFDIKLENGKVVQWQGRDGEDACKRAADCLSTPAVAWREAAPLVVQVHHSQIIG